MQNQNVQINLDQLIANPYRDLNLFPINPTVVAGLKESINDTGFWDNLVVRVENNTLADGTIINSAVELAALFESGHDWNGEKFELCYGHHRLAAVTDMGFASVNLPVKFVTDEQMLKMMANENKDSQQNQIAVKLETVRQVKSEIEAKLAEFKTFAAYKKEVGKAALFTNAQGFNSAVENGVGFRTVHKFLGETWSQTDIRYAFSVLTHIDLGYFLQEDIIDLPSIALLEGVGNIAAFIYGGDAKKDLEAPDWPVYFKEAIIQDVIERCRADKQGWQKVTVAQLRKAKSAMVNDGVNPAAYLKSGRGKEAFDIVAATKELVFVKEKDLDYHIGALAELKAKDGFEGYHELDELIKRVQKSIERSLAAGAKGEGEDEELESIEETDLEQELAGAESEVAVPDMFAAPAGEIEGEEETTIPAAALSATYVQTSQHLVNGTNALIERSEEIIDEDGSFGAAAAELLASTAALVYARLGKEKLVEVFNSVTAE